MTYPILKMGRRIHYAVTAIIVALFAIPSFTDIALSAPNEARILDTQENLLKLETNHGVVIQLPSPASDIFVANPNIADVQVKSPRTLYVFGIMAGETSIFALSQNEEIVFSANIEISPNLGRIEESLTRLLPSSTISIQDINGLIIVDGYTHSPEQAETAIRMIRTAVGAEAEIINRLIITMPTQINLRVKIAEVGRDVIKELGINWDGTIFGGETLFGLAQGNPAIQYVVDPATNLPVKQFVTRNNGVNSLIGNITNNSMDINTVIDALETEGFLSVLAEPNLTALSGESANFLAGGEFPIPVPDQGNISLEFKQFGVGLTFTPKVLSEGRINLQVAPEVSQLSSNGAISINGISVPALTTRRAATTVELASGQSFAIAGLLQSSVTQDQEKFPWLGDIPILGALFRSQRFRRNETELVIIVTPYIVRPIDARSVSLPTDGLIARNDSERFLFGEQPNISERPISPLDGSSSQNDMMNSDTSLGFDLGDFTGDQHD